MHQAGVDAGERQPQCGVDLIRLHAAESRLFLIDDEPELFLVVFDVRVGVDHPIGGHKRPLHLFGYGDLALVIGAVNLGHERLENRRPGRDLRDLHVRVPPLRDRRDKRASPLGDGVALRFSLAFRKEVDLKVADVRPGAEKVVPHQAVEVERRRRAGVHLVIGNLGDGGHGRSDLARDRGRPLQRRSLRHIDDDLELALVIERQHLHAHQLHGEHRHGQQQRDDHRRQESVAQTGLADQARHNPAVVAGGKALGGMRRLGVAAE